ncbi:MAG: transposase [Burkholderiaceae bacterium]|nr:transposase [Burkholderiaceae bacterium]
MTNATMALAELAEKGADVDMLRQMVQFAAQRLMEMEAESLCGAGCDEKNPERINSRNGYRERAWETRAGTVELRVPKLRQGRGRPVVLGQHHQQAASTALPPRRRMAVPAVAPRGLPVTAIHSWPCSGGFCVRWAQAPAPR